ncbi:C-GCAxxG-C-C family protein [Fuchsiella alkaliacetigena]|uniref:C-GCAxxG-C-C family protein n=1 Tax=Fuchsiella alkaliacetigena TaxID=957042 RepID=UPI00200B90AF|nr:C-GCAxxG-C-C family protein [Fuchsiella alkaliacetigena]MCK8825510.1 C-GCAxxG-C-C family protein [Fuchsiella alkaliacetigena]
MSTLEENLAKKAQHIAEDYFRNQGFLCSEAILITINELLGKEFSSQVVKLASGFPKGLGNSGCLCGAVSGGVMALGFKYGRTEPGAAMPKSLPNSAALHDYIQDEYGSTCCRVLTSSFVEFDSPERIEHCIEITGKVAAWVMDRFIKDNLV